MPIFTLILSYLCPLAGLLIAAGVVFILFPAFAKAISNGAPAAFSTRILSIAAVSFTLGGAPAIPMPNSPSVETPPLAASSAIAESTTVQPEATAADPPPMA